MRKGMKSNEKVFVKSFPGATIEDMGDYVRPTMKHNPDLVVIHAGTNNLRSDAPANQIADDIIKLAMQVKGNDNDVMVSGLTTRVDGLSKKAQEVNLALVDECSKYSIHFINNQNIEGCHLNGSGLHLNYKGTVLLANNFLEAIRI